MSQTNELEELLTEQVKEQYLSKEIIEAKNQMEVVDRVQQLRDLSYKQRQYENAIEQIRQERKNIKRTLKRFCKHTEVTHYIQDGYERAEHSYQCNHCKQDLRIHDEFDHKNINKTVNM